LLYEDKVPLGSGLSSSAAIEIATALALVSLGYAANGINRKINMTELALISQKAEHNYVGVKCGIMDQFASAMGKKDMAIFLDCRDLTYELVPLKLNDYRLVIGFTNKKRSLGEGKYNERRKECEEGLAMLQKAMPGIEYLRDVSVQDFLKYENLLVDDVIRKRVKHVVYENERVLESVKALKNNDLRTFGELMNQSHDSLRDLYEVTGKELDTLVNAARKADGVLGSRMTGAGFGGSTVSLVHKDSIDDFIKQVGSEYEKEIGYSADFYVSEIGDGGREEEI